MGTNFYAKTRLLQAQKDEINKYLSEDNYDPIINILEKSKDIHIGKRSCGWKFLWDVHNFKYFEKSKKSMFEWLENQDIIDEYGEHYTFDEFINEIPIKDGWDIKSYYEENPDKFSYFYGAHIGFPGEGLDINSYGEFYLDDCRCSTYEDFA